VKVWAVDLQQNLVRGGGRRFVTVRKRHKIELGRLGRGLATEVKQF